MWYNAIIRTSESGDDVAKTTRDASAKQESRVAEILDAKVVVNSGARPPHLGDVIDEYTLYDCKTLMSVQKTHNIKKEWMEKIQNESNMKGRSFSALVFDFGDGKDYVALPIDDFKTIYAAFKEANE